MMVSSKLCDIAVIGAGLSGLICAQQLQRAGYSVVVLEKSRGVGGRLATRRLAGTGADHGAPYLEEQGPYTEDLISVLGDRGLLKSWGPVRQVSATGDIQPADSHLRYVMAEGMAGVGKFLAEKLTVWRGQRVTAITPSSKTRWSLTLDPLPSHPAQSLTARGIVLAIPAPQAATLLEPLVEEEGLPPDLLATVNSVQFDPCVTAIAVYPQGSEKTDAPDWSALQFSDHPSLSWVSLESRKRLTDSRRVVVLQSNGAFAQTHLETPDLTPAGKVLLEAASAWLPGLENPDLLQVHRWRYARVNQGLSNCPSTAVPLPLVCAGDWCGGDGLESALEVGEAAAWAINTRLDKRTLSVLDFTA